MFWWEYVIIALAVVFVIAVIIVNAVRKKQGKSSCGSDCSSCPYCCSKSKKDE